VHDEAFLYTVINLLFGLPCNCVVSWKPCSGEVFVENAPFKHCYWDRGACGKPADSIAVLTGNWICFSGKEPMPATSVHGSSMDTAAVAQVHLHALLPLR
jgi:hypothetical protein